MFRVKICVKNYIKTKRDVFIWSSTEGLKKNLKDGQESVNNGNEPIDALNFIDNYNNPAILILKDIHPLLGLNNRNADYNLIRKIRDVAGSLKNAEVSKNVVIIAPSLVLPLELQKDITVVDFDLPTLDEIKSLLNEMIEMNESSGIVIDLKEDEKEVLCKAAQGLTLQEAEKGFGGNGGERDGGTATRVFGTFLTWMSEKTKPVFVIATANNINALPSEMLRKGRFDEIFFVDLPTKAERKVIFKLHLEKRLKGSISKDFAVTDTLLNKLAEITEGFAGAEIEQVVISALFEAFSENRTLNKEDLYKVINNTVPLSTTQSEQILAIREWANERAVAATAHDESYNYVPEETQEQIERKKKEKKSTETVKKARGGRTIDF